MPVFFWKETNYAYICTRIEKCKLINGEIAQLVRAQDS